MQSIKRLKQEEFWQIYDNRLKEDFPESEIRRRENFQRLWDLDCYEVLGYFEENTLTGYASFIVPADGRVVFGDYFAIQKAKRGKGSGSGFLKDFIEYFSDFEYLLFEVEDPAYATDEADKLNRERRIGFYERLGAFDCGISSRVLGDDYLIFALSTKQEAQQEIQKSSMDWFCVIKKIYELTFPNPESWKKIEINSFSSADDNLQ